MTNVGTEVMCPNATDEGDRCDELFIGEDMVNVMGNDVVMWHRDANKLETVYNMFDIVNPIDLNPTPTSDSWTFEVGATAPKCGGGDDNTTLYAIDYHHVSSVFVGTSRSTTSLIVTLRNMNTVMALDPSGAGVQWMFSSTIPAGFKNYTALTVERDIDLFYAPHDVTMLEDGRLMMIDDGNDRPGCVPLMDYKGCFSRAVIYALDIDNQKAHLEWQLEMPYQLDTNLGAVRTRRRTQRARPMKERDGAVEARAGTRGACKRDRAGRARSPAARSGAVV